jgi:chemotaxis signal transduction protein
MPQFETRQLCTFYLGSELFGVEVVEVQEVLRQPVISPVPLATRFVSGLMNLRGSIVSCIDLRLRFGMPPASAGSEQVQVVTKTDSGLVSFQVDRIGDVVEIMDSELEPPPATLTEDAKKLITGVYKLKDRLLLSVSVRQVLEFDDNSTQSS